MAISTAKLPRGAVRCSITLVRRATETSRATRTRAHLFSGTPHDDKLRLCESIILESFPSPLSMSFIVASGGPMAGTSSTGYAPVVKPSEHKLVTYLMIDDLIGMDQVRTRSLHQCTQDQVDVSK
eukprot:CAMPEP_0177782032 /NCGR_PEP_ID=MMETSP0491_2-20121128/18210_1 /TAXON_ID=63592 /ORGANISM="Tetraselmis chuii, Strain PLY429" /LENGTH=124 /DNA_ID=CAMNT_0019302223 /DNA_START=179 /DNA_END=550 /DNA_ORIENTATION=+